MFLLITSFTFAFHIVVCSVSLEEVGVGVIAEEAEDGSTLLLEIFGDGGGGGGASLLDLTSLSMSTASCSKLWKIPFQDPQLVCIIDR
jgi:hypothetical protein